MSDDYILVKDMVAKSEEFGLRVALGSCGDCVIRRVDTELLRKLNVNCSRDCQTTIKDYIFKGNTDAEIKVVEYLKTMAAIKGVHE